jgi:hypothetical protein
VKSSISSTGEVIGDDVTDFADDLSLLAEFSGPSGLVAQFQCVGVCELIWLENNFRLYAADLAIPAADVSRRVNRYFSTRVEQRKTWKRIYGSKISQLLSLTIYHFIAAKLRFR